MFEMGYWAIQNGFQYTIVYGTVRDAKRAGGTYAGPFGSLNKAKSHCTVWIGKRRFELAAQLQEIKHLTVAEVTPRKEAEHEERLG